MLSTNNENMKNFIPEINLLICDSFFV